MSGGGRPPAAAALRVALGVAAAWTVLGVAMGAQAAMASRLQGGDVVPLTRAVPQAVLQALPWIPVTLAAIALAARAPLTRERWRARLPLHLAAAALLAVVANVLVVLTYWAGAGRFGGLAVLAREGVRWATINLHVALLVYAAVVAMTQAVLFYRRTRERELRLARVEGQLARAHLQALTAQIRPHFLFNTLHTIGQLWRSGRSDDADAVLDHLGGLFHRVQRVTAQLEVPLAEELELVREYLAIESARFRDRLRASVCATPEAADCLVPPLILQPIVENAVRHGISAVSSAGCVEVRATVQGGRLLLAVSDDGPGVGRSRTPPGSGTGLRNTRERLAQLYGADASLAIGAGEAGGTRVVLDLPATRECRAPAEAAGD